MCPPGVDQTTRRAQRWHILAPKVEAQYDITNDCESDSGHTSFTTFLRGDYTWDAFEKLVNRAPVDAGKTETIMARLPRSISNGSGSLLDTLPNEMLAIIFNDDALHAVDLLALGLCSRSLWQQCLGHLRVTISKGSWANTPLLCTGTYLTSLPPVIYDMQPLLKEQEESWRSRQPPPGRGMRGGPGMHPARRWNWNAVSKYGDFSLSNSRKLLLAFDNIFATASRGIPVADRKLLRQTLDLLLSSNDPKPGTNWTLCNHSIKQFIHLKCAFNGGMEPQLHVKGVPRLSLDKALLMRISWTDKGIYQSSMPALQKLVHGEWAGHRFDVVDGSQLLEEGWTDVTAEMVAEWKEHIKVFSLNNIDGRW